MATRNDKPKSAEDEPADKAPTSAEKKPGANGQRRGRVLRKDLELIRKRIKILDLFELGASTQQIADQLTTSAARGNCC